MGPGRCSQKSLGCCRHRPEGLGTMTNRRDERHVTCKLKKGVLRRRKGDEAKELTERVKTNGLGV